MSNSNYSVDLNLTNNGVVNGKFVQENVRQKKVVNDIKF